MPKRCIITMGDRDWYLKGVDRLVASLKQVGWSGNDHQHGIMARKSVPKGCPDPKAVRCAFKYYLMKEAEAAGFTQLLWMDASFWAVRSLEPIFDVIDQQGWYLVKQGWNTGQWCCDSALKPLGITREEAFKIYQLVGGFVGINLEHEKGKRFLDEMFRLAVEKTAFVGVRSKGGGFISHDPRVLGHRADQTCASVLSWRYEMTPIIHEQSHVKFTYGWKGPQGNHWKITDVPQPKCVLHRGGVRAHDLQWVPYP